VLNILGPDIFNITLYHIDVKVAETKTPEIPKKSADDNYFGTGTMAWK
jgi:hypothetical protein